MCGHVGIAGNLKNDHEKTMKHLLLFDFLRGPDSTGFAAIRESGQPEIVKIASHPLDLFSMKRFDAALNAYQSKVFVGHNRAATRGLVNAYNAHPYTFGNITGAHNGTLDTSCTKELEEKLGEKFEVDSMAIFAAIEKFGIDETVPMLKGAWALVWYDREEDTVNFIRNKERPMWMAWSKDLDTLYWASEYPTIDAAIKLGSSSLELHDEDGVSFWGSAVDYLYSFKISELKKGAKERPDGRVKKLLGKEPAPVTTVVGFVDPFGRGTSSTTTHLGSTVSNKKQTPVVVIHKKVDTSEPFGDVVGQGEFKINSDYGCQWCEEPVGYFDVGLTYFRRDGKILCQNCTNGDDSNKVFLVNLEAYE